MAALAASWVAAQAPGAAGPADAGEGRRDAAPLADDQRAALRSIARSEPFAWPGLTADQAAVLRDDVEACHDRMREIHLLDGQVVEVRWRADDPDVPWSYEALGDSANMTGLYLAALVLRQATEPDAATAVEVAHVLDALDRLSVVSGRAGTLARFAGDPDDPVHGPAVARYVARWGRGPSRTRPGMGRWVYPGAAPHDDLVWLGNASRDTYDGAAAGLGLAMTRSPSAATRERARQLVLRIGGRLRADGFAIRDGRGHVTAPTPGFRLAWIALLVAADPAAHGDLAARRDGRLRRLGRRGPRVYPMDYREYFANVLTADRIVALAAAVDDAAGRQHLRDAAEALMDDAAHHLNAHLAGAAALAGLDDDPRVVALLQGLLLDMAPVPRRAGRPGRPDLEARMAEDGRHALEALLPGERPGSDYLWQRAPLDRAPMRTGALEYACVDLLLPYWMGRAAGTIPAPQDPRP